MKITKTAMATLERYSKRRVSRERAAEILNVSERTLTRMMAQAGLERVESPYAERRTAAQERREVREAAAKQVDLGNITVEQAAVRAECSERTIYRYLGKT